MENDRERPPTRGFTRRSGAETDRMTEIDDLKAQLASLAASQAQLQQEKAMALSAAQNPKEERPRAASAGDLYLAAVEEWTDHAEACNRDVCEACVLLINRMRLARKVYRNSAHKAATTDRLLAGLREYGQHKNGCGYRLTGGQAVHNSMLRAKGLPEQHFPKCTCGLADLLAALSGEPT